MGFNESANNFKPEIIAAAVEREIEKNCILTEDGGYQYGGEIKRFGTLVVKGVIRPVISDYTGAPSQPEKPETTAVTITLDQAKKVFFMLDDVDRAKGVDGYIEALKADSVAGFSEERDRYYGKLFKKAKMRVTAGVMDTPEKVKKAIDDALKMMMNKGIVFEKTKTYLDLTPSYYLLFRDYLSEIKTSNDELVRKGVIGMYNNIFVRYSTLLSTEKVGTDSFDVMALRTSKAIGFKGGITEMKESPLTAVGIVGNGVLGVDVYGGNVVRQDEIVSIYGKE